MSTAIERDLVSGRYRLLELLGSGTTGQVWRAEDELLHRPVAVKEVGTPPDVTMSEMLDLQLATMREARAAARLDHPGVVQVYDVIWRPGRSFIVLEYVESRSLHQVVQEDGPLSPREVARIGVALVDALSAAHRAGVLHRDVEPHHVLLAADGRVVLSDFGLAEVAGVTRPAGEAPTGSAAYLAPERLHRARPAAAADLWSLGATLYTAVQGRPPFADAEAVLSGPPEPAPLAGPLAEVLDGLLTKDPARRMTADQAEPRLRRIADRAIGVFAVPGSLMSTPGRSLKSATARPALARSTRIAVGVAVALLAGTVGTALTLDSDPAPTTATTTTAAEAPPAAPIPSPSTAACRLGSTDAGSAVSADQQPHRYALPDGWRWHTDEGGFTVAVPPGWTRSAEGDLTCFRDAGGGRAFTVRATTGSDDDPVARWKSAEQTVLAADALPGYQRIGLDPLLLEHGGAAWEYTWTAGDGLRWHERRLLVSVGADRAYQVEWTTRDQDWPITEPVQRLVLASLS